MLKSCKQFPVPKVVHTRTCIPYYTHAQAQPNFFFLITWKFQKLFSRKEKRRSLERALVLIRHLHFCLASLAGYYVYIETSCPRRLNDSAILTFTGSNSSGVCFSFYYHMYGNTTNTLNIYSRGQKVWSKSGNQGNVWKRDNFSIGAGRYDVCKINCQ